MLPLRHIHRKKHHNLKKKTNNPLDYLVYLASFAGPVMTIPQIYDIWVGKSLNVNEITWGSYFVIAVIWLCYGIVHREKPIIFSNILGIIASGSVVLGGLIFR
ncbi:MAG TPA: hypothetical protein VG917_02390 [Patescibacteria group bacterium]|nr:hypothetical protein [Patescibacteria group bacterium]